MGRGCFAAPEVGWGSFADFSVGTPTILCQAIRRSCQSYTLQIYWRLEERRDGAVSRVVSVFFCAVYIVLLGQCYVAMPSGYKLVITRALGLHGIYCTQPSGLAPSCFSAIYSIHPLCPCYNYNIKVVGVHVVLLVL